MKNYERIISFSLVMGNWMDALLTPADLTQGSRISVDPQNSVDFTFP